MENKNITKEEKLTEFKTSLENIIEKIDKYSNEIYFNNNNSLFDRDCWDIEEKLNNAIESLEEVKELLENI